GCPVADLYRCAQHRVAADKCLLADGGAVLLDPIVVDGDGARADIGLFAHKGVAHIAEVPHVHAPLQRGSLYLGEVAQVHFFAQLRTWSQVAVWPHRDTALQLAPFDHRSDDTAVVAYGRVDDMRIGTNHAVGPYISLTFEHHA